MYLIAVWKRLNEVVRMRKAGGGLNLCVCMYVCMNVCMYVCAPVQSGQQLQPVRVYMYVSMRMYVCMHVCMRVCVYVCVCELENLATA